MDENSKKALERAKAKRKILKTSTTKIINRINELLSVENVDNTLLEECKENLNEKAEQIFQLDLEIENLCTEMKDYETEIASNIEYRDRITETKTKLKIHFKKLIDMERNKLDKQEISKNESANSSSENEQEISKNESENSPSKNDSSTSVLSEYRKIKVQLPKLHIEPFYGDLEHFQEFWAQFESSIDNNDDLSKVDKYNYLKAFLKGPALLSIQGLLVTEKNYDQACKILKQRYGNKEILVRTHINRLLNLSPVKSASQLSQLRNLYDSIEIQIRSLENLGVELNSYGNLLYPLIIKLIPDYFALEFNRQHETYESWKVSELINFLRKEIETRERTFLFGQKTEIKSVAENKTGNSYQKYPSRYISKENKSHKFVDRRQELTPSATALSTFEEKCIFCNNSSHKSESCIKSQNDKIDSLKKCARCFICLKKNHLAKFCRSGIKCEKCSRRHNKLICTDPGKSDERAPIEVEKCKQTPTAEGGNDSSSVFEVSLSCMNENKNITMLQTVRAEAESPDKRFRKSIKILFDLGSQRSFIKTSVSKQLELRPTGKELLSIYSFGQTEPRTEEINKVSLVLINPFNKKVRIKIEALETQTISATSVLAPDKKIIDLCEKRGIKLSDTYLDSNNEEISLLIGSDIYWKIVTGKIFRISEQLVLSESKLGWTISGNESTKIALVALNISQNAVKISKEPENDTTSEEMRNFWQLDILGIESNSDDSHKLEDDVTYKKFRDSVKYENDRYIVCLPWKKNAGKLQDNFKIARKRLQSLRRRFLNDSEFYERYEAVINKHLEEGIAEESEYAGNDMEYFMPHQAVIRENKDTTKLRVVFDASSHDEGCLSLNDCLESGPNLYPDMLQLLIKFRLHKFAITADIKEAFLQVALRQEDRNAVKFLWQDQTSKEPKIFRMTRVIFGGKSSTFLLGATIKTHIEKYKLDYPETFSILNNCIYVDDLITGTDTINEAAQEAENIKKILKEGSFEMRKWTINEVSLQKIWEEKEDYVRQYENKVLGYIWNRQKDTFQIESSELIDEERRVGIHATKREVLRIIGRLYDPLGLLNPFSIRARILLQEIWKCGLKWDDALPDELRKVWETWEREFHEIQSLEIPRHYFENLEKNIIEDCQLHCFVDSSEKAYGAVVYLRYTYEMTTRTAMIVSKCRVAPLKKLSLPRLELMSALIGTRITSTIKKYLKEFLNVTTYFWTDSTIALHWIKGPTEKWKQFVQNRAREIQERSEPDSWNYCPTKENPADMLTRGISIAELKRKEAWWHGPLWLKKADEFWPKMPTGNKPNEEIQKERKKVSKVHQVSCLLENNENTLFELEKCSNLNKVLRCTAWIKRYIHNIRNKGKQSGPLSADELREAEIYWIKSTQRKHFAVEIKALKQGKPLSPGSRIRMFNPRLDEENVLRIGGRLQNADLEIYEKHPIILPDSSHLAELVIKQEHDKIGHAGIAGTLAQIREKYWLLKGRRKVKDVISKCITCRRYKSRPICQDIAPLPPDRVRETFPFQITGVDFAGPLYTREKNKAYIVLFTCAVTRAIHLELIPDLTTETFILALRKFIARRGLCHTIYSDNAKTFKKANKELKKLWSTIKDEEVREFVGKNGILWKFIVERAAWWGGFWERLVRSVKSCLKKILGRASLTLLELETTLLEVEAIVNSRPLTYVSDDSTEPHLLTPAHFLIGRRMLTLPTGNNLPTSTKEDLTKRHVYKRLITEKIWRRWKTEYLLQLRSAHQVKTAIQAPNIQEGTVVLVYDDKKPRLLWKMGLVTNLHIGRDGKVRSCTLKLPNGTVINRAVQHLYPMELELKGQ